MSVSQIRRSCDRTIRIRVLPNALLCYYSHPNECWDWRTWYQVPLYLKVIFLQTFFFPWWAEEIITLCLNVEMTANIAKVRKFEENFRLNIENRATFTIHGSHGSFAPIYVHCRAKRATKYIELRLNAHIRYSLFFHPLPSQTSHLMYILPQKWPCIYMLFASREVHIGKKLCP